MQTIVGRLLLVGALCLAGAACGDGDADTGTAESDAGGDASAEATAGDVTEPTPDEGGGDLADDATLNAGQLATVQVGGETLRFGGQTCIRSFDYLVFVGFDANSFDTFSMQAAPDGIDGRTVDLTVGDTIYLDSTIETMDVSVDEGLASGTATFAKTLVDGEDIGPTSISFDVDCND